MKSNPFQEPSAFTLVELLSIIALLALIASMMIPALARTGPKSKDLICQNNHRQIAAAVLMYTQDNHDFYPPNPDDGTRQPGYAWCSGNVSIDGGPDQFNPDFLSDPQHMLLAPETGKKVNLFNCPTDPRVGRYDGAAFYPNSPLIGKIVRAARTISLSQAVGTVDAQYGSGGGHSGIPNQPTNGPWLTGNYGQNNYINGPFATFGKSGAFRASKPAQVFLMADEAIYSINDGTLATCAELNNPRFIDFPSSAHEGAGTFSFCDGHTELHKWTGSAILAESQTQWNASHSVRSTSDKADFAWLATHSSARIR